MGEIFQYQCTGCDLTAFVSGGAGRGWDIVTQTVFCRGCNTLCDVLVDRTHDPTHPRGELDAEEKHSLRRCPNCQSTDNAAWRDGDPCPICGGKVVRSHAAILWD